MAGSLPPPSPVRSIPPIPDSVHSTPGQMPQRRPVSVSSHISQDAPEPPQIPPPPLQGMPIFQAQILCAESF